MSNVTRSVQVMELLARRGPIGVRAASKTLGLPLGSLHRLLLDFEAEGIAERTRDGGWVLSFRLLEITGLHLDRIELPRLARPHAERMAEITGETININALSGLEGVCVDKVRGNEGMQLDMRIGSHGPLYVGGAGKAMLAHLSEAAQQRVLDAPMPALTETTITTPEALKAELARIRDRGYSIDDQELVMGVWCVAVPVFDRNGRAVGAISVTGPTPKREGPEIEATVMMLTEACAEISRRLGYTGDWPRLQAAARKRA